MSHSRERCDRCGGFLYQRRDGDGFQHERPVNAPTCFVPMITCKPCHEAIADLVVAQDIAAVRDGDA